MIFALETYVYAEDIFLLNAAVDAMVLLSIPLCRKERVRPLRLTAASFIGGSYALAAFVMPAASGLAVKTAVMLLMVLIMTKKPLPVKAAVNMAIVFVSSAAAAGTAMLFGASALTVRPAYFGGEFLIHIGADRLLFAVAVSQVTVCLCVRKLLSVLKRKNHMLRASIVMPGGVCRDVSLFLDSGDMLTTLSGQPVAAVTFKLFSELTGMDAGQLLDDWSFDCEKITGAYPQSKICPVYIGGAFEGRAAPAVKTERVTADGCADLCGAYIVPVPNIRITDCDGIINPDFFERR